jgi:exosortase
LVLLAGCVVLHLTGYLIQQPRVSIVAMLAGIWVLAAIVWGWPLGRAILFPMVLLVFCVPIGTLAEPLTVPLRQVSTDISVGISRGLLGIPVQQQGVLIKDPLGRYHYEVAAACSGMRSLITLFAINSIYAFLTFRTRWKRLLVITLALPLALLGNVIRLVGIVVAAEAFGQEAGHVAHDWFGFVTFALALAALAAAGHWLKEPNSPLPQPATADGGVA